MLVLARACGIQSVESRIIEVGGRDVLLVKHFDREKTDEGYLRARMISGLTLLRTEDTHQHRERWSYVLMVEELRRVCAKPKEEAAELFRRMVFNALISNIDDHPRNHAIIAKDKDWKLSPAYDLTPSMPVSLERRDLALSCGDWDRYAHVENLLSQSQRFYLGREQADALITGMEKQIVGTWYETARRAGVSAKDCDTIGSAFVYPGFRLPVEGLTQSRW